MLDPHMLCHNHYFSHKAKILPLSATEESQHSSFYRSIYKQPIPVAISKTTRKYCVCSAVTTQ